MQYKTLLSVLALGVAFAGEAAAARGGGFGQGGFGGQGKGGQNQGQGQGQGGAGNANTATATASAASAATAASSVAAQATGATGGNGGNGGNSNALELNPSAVQTGSESDGQNASGAASGQAPSNTDPANFINFCVGQTLTNGLQQKQGSCNGIVMGQIPASTQMVSTIVTFPQSGQNIEENQTFNLSANIQNIQAGSFTNPDTTYYAAPQALNSGGEVIGHMHFSVQTLGNNLNPTTAPDASKFAFFKGVDDAGDGKGNLQAVVTGGLPAGNYRVCTMSSSSNHQPVLMPVAQRGPQDDCTKFTVGATGGNSGSAGSTASAGSVSTASATAAAAGSTASSTASTGAGNGNKGNKGATGGKGGKGAGGNRARFVRYFRG